MLFETAHARCSRQKYPPSFYPPWFRAPFVLRGHGSISLFDESPAGAFTARFLMGNPAYNRGTRGNVQRPGRAKKAKAEAGTLSDTRPVRNRL